MLCRREPGGFPRIKAENRRRIKRFAEDSPTPSLGERPARSQDDFFNGLLARRVLPRDAGSAAEHESLSRALDCRDVGQAIGKWMNRRRGAADAGCAAVEGGPLEVKRSDVSRMPPSPTRFLATSHYLPCVALCARKMSGACGMRAFGCRGGPHGESRRG